MTWTILNANADCIPLTDKSVQCVVSSPPYWGLRDYGTATWVGGDEGCDHKPPASRKGDYPDSDRKQQTNSGSFGYREWHECGKCGATRIDSQIGLEKSPEEYVAKIVAVFREVWRVLRDDGTCWVNLGDSYGHGTDSGRKSSTNGAVGGWQSEANEIRRNGIKAKDLVGIPWRVAFALQADGWYLRSDIIWSKPNPMPESVTDRPTKAHEYIFLLSKKERYFFDQDAVREDAICDRKRGTHGYSHVPNGGDNSGLSHGVFERRNIRTVWEIATQSFPEAHFATFPEEIAIRCIKAGTSEKGACAECGAAWERVTETTKTFESGSGRSGNPINGKQNLAASATNSTPDIRMGPTVQSKTLGWQRTCDHEHESRTRPCIVLDPFSGAGTVPLVADKLNRRGIGLELKSDYCRMAERRCYDDAPLLAAMEG